ncbi:MAG: FHA domain-containing protein [Lachnospiraceae bacterium]|nr:FHA domain-containing protein [Lachnospiraceae bacterium]
MISGEEYRKEPDGKTYLLLKKTKDTFEEPMIQRAKPTGVLPMARSERTDAYKYEITGKKNLAMTFERVPMNAEQIEKVVDGILEVLGRGREYLLSEDNFILDPEYIYLCIPEYEVTLCYYPEYNHPFAEQLGKLFEVLLNRVDYREERAIAMVYALYMQLQEPDMTLERIRDKLREQAENQDAAIGKRWEYAESEKPRDVYSRDISTEAIAGKGRSRSRKEEISGREKKSPRKNSFWERLRKETERIRFTRGGKEDREYALPGVPCVREPAPEWEPKYTKVLSVKKTETGPALISQRNGETVFLTKFPFYVGSHAGYMDYTIPQDTVSRFHAKFIKQGKTVLLSDLNSTNGTKVNGRELAVQEQVPLVNGDRIWFADAEFVYFEK